MATLSADERRVAETPADARAWAAYLPELRAKGDSRAPLIARELEGDETAPARAFVEENAGEWLNLASYHAKDPDPGLLFEWEHGFVIGLVVDLRPMLLKWPPLADQFASFLDSRAATLLRRIDVRRVEDGTEDRYFERLCAQDRPALRELTIYAESVPKFAGTPLGALERLTLRRTRELAPFTLPNLRALTIDSHQLTRGALEALARSELPQLSCLRLRFAGSDTLKPKHRPAADDVAKVIQSLPGLRALEVHGASFGDALLDHLAATPALVGLDSLVLTGSELGPAGARALRTLASAPGSLGTVSLERGALHPEVIRELGETVAGRVTPVTPSAETAARYLAAITAEVVAARLDSVGANAASRAAAQRVRRWMGVWLFEEAAAVAKLAGAPAAGVLAWALHLGDDPLASADIDHLARTVRVGEPLQAFVESARLRDAKALEAGLARIEASAALSWHSFADVTALREQARAGRWLVGVAASWTDVPAHVVLHELPAPAAASGPLAARVGKAWVALRKRFREPLPLPASERAVDAAEREIGCRCPADLRASLLRYGGGSYPPIGLLSVDGARRFWRDLDASTDWTREPRARADGSDASLANMKSGSWRRGWLPLTSSESESDFYAADLEPAPGGAPGQTFFYSHEIPGPECVMAGSFVEWLEWAATAEEFETADDD